MPEIYVPDYLVDYVRSLSQLSGTNPSEAIAELIQYTAICPTTDVQHAMYTGRYVDSIKGETGRYIAHGGLIIQPQNFLAIPVGSKLSIKATILRPSPIWYQKSF